MSHLATGGMAEIYLARAVGIQNFERLVVVKRILPQWARDPQFVAMFLDEARLAAQLSHPNIAQVFDIGEESGTYFFAMEFVHGEDLRTVLRKNQQDRERLPLELAISIVIETASALHHAHEATDAYGNSLELVHRDVSPSNVLLSYDGAVKVVDFGIAKAANRQQETRTGCLKGKIAYMAPEQCLGEELDRRADVFALGILLYEATTGRRCFDGASDFKTLEMITNGTYVAPAEYVPSFPPELDHIVRRALAVDPDIRYQTAEALATALEMFAAKTGLPLSRRHRSRYLRERFADKLVAWEEAQREGKSLASHLSDSMMFSLTPSGVVPMGGTPSGISSNPLFDSNVPAFSQSNTPLPGSNPPIPGSNPPQTGPIRLGSEPVFSETYQTAAAPPRRRGLKIFVALLLTAAATAAFVVFGLPKLGMAPWTTSAGAADDSKAEPDRTAAEIEAAARARAEAEARAAAAEERLKAEARAREEAEARARAREEEARARAEAIAAAEALAAAEAERKKERRRTRRKRKSSSSGKTTGSRDKSWQANSPLLPSRSKKKK